MFNNSVYSIQYEPSEKTIACQLLSKFPLIVASVRSSARQKEPNCAKNI